MINAPELAGEMIGSERPKAALGAYSLLTLARLPSFRTRLDDAEVAEFLIGAPT